MIWLALLAVAWVAFLAGWIFCAVFTEATADSRLPYHGEVVYDSSRTAAENAEEWPKVERL